MNVRFSYLSVFIVAMILISACSHNKNAGDEVINAYEEHPGVITLKIPPGLVGVFISKNDEDLKKAFRNMESIKLILVDMSKTDSVDLIGFASGFKDKLEIAGFSEILSANNGNERVKILILEKEGKIQEMMGLFSSSEDFLGINLAGEIEPDQLANIIKEIKISDFNFN